MTVAVLRMPSWTETMSSLRPPKEVKSTQGGLTALAPRYRAWVDEVSDRVGPTPAQVSRPRLPPRSRFGCWTCRTRKVKCDEARPECTPCSRLGHNCDYNPRLSFKDDTARVVEKVSGSTGGSGPAWDPSPAQRPFLNPAKDDLLPSFALLSNDDDREKKAGFRRPGSYLVVVNPASFAEFEDYRDKGEDESYPSTQVSRRPSNSPRTIGNTTASDAFHFADDFLSNNYVSDDPDIVVLKVFEDEPRRMTPSPSGLSAVRGRSSRASTFSNTSALSVPAPIPMARQHRSPSVYRHDNSPLMQMANPNGLDYQIIQFYRTFIRRHLLQVNRDTLGTPLDTGSVPSADVLEHQAARFQPLYHALMAFSAFSMSQRSGSTQSLGATALQHYQQALPSLQASLRTESDLASDGVFLTHFMLLLYETAAGELYGMSLWQQHISQLLRIVLLRRQMYECEPYSFIVWWVANIDTHVVLSGMGNGRFVETMLRHNLLPSGLEADDNHQPATSIPAATPANPNLSDPLYSSLPSALAFHRRICTLAAQLGLLARDLRAEVHRSSTSHDPVALSLRQQRVAGFQDLLRRTWAAQVPTSFSGGYANLVTRVEDRGLFEHSFALHRALMIYTHTSLPGSNVPAASASSSPINHPEVRSASNDILCLAREIVFSSHFERKFIVFPLFMAGFVAHAPQEKAETLSLLGRLEEDTVGKTVVATKELLEKVYARQDETIRNIERRRSSAATRSSERGVSGSEYGLGVQDWDQHRRQSWGGGLAGAAGRRMEPEHMDVQQWDAVDWVRLVQELGLLAVNCRL